MTDTPLHPFSCWLCDTGNGHEDDDMAFDTEFDTYYHPSCLADADCETVLEYETERTKSHEIE